MKPKINDARNKHRDRKENKQPTSSQPTTAALPSDESLSKISDVLVKQFEKREKEKRYAPVKEVLGLLGKGVLLSAAILAPKSAPLIKDILNQSPDWDEWKHFNISYLQRTLRRLEAQKQIEIQERDGKQIVSLTMNGKRKVLQFSIDHLMIDKPKHWDGKWRVVLYDVPKINKKLGDLIRENLRSLGFYAIQDSVYLFPYPCFKQIEFLREFYNLGDAVQYMLVDKIERDEAFKTYFNLT
jgi:hypothetical protein